MSDIVERLRRTYEIGVFEAIKEGVYVRPNEAADEIERLRASRAQPDREAVARMIDPDTWPMPQDNSGIHWHQRRHVSLTKADAILNLIAQPASESVKGMVLVPKIPPLEWFGKAKALLGCDPVDARTVWSAMIAARHLPKAPDGDGL